MINFYILTGYPWRSQKGGTCETGKSCVHQQQTTAERWCCHNSRSEQLQNPDYCKSGMCKEMPADIENKCCRQKRCLSKTNVFVNICIDKENLQTAIKNLSDTYVFTPR